MRIQHNIAAMNAYRNYNINTSAVSKNLEKLSSGYKINRAGDDAAGLAISEKMRAQITGLDAATKNVKYGISLVKTAEGAMQEVQDMLNRMVYLATQSANGTYDNDVDRANLQKEVDQLQSEINRIADSANFNGIKLLDGSLDTTAKITGEADLFKADGSGALTVVSDGQLGNKPQAGVFELDLTNFEGTAKAGTLTLNVFGNTIAMKTKADGTALAMGDTVTGEDIAKAIADHFDGSTAVKGDYTIAYGMKMTAEADGAKVTFTMDKAPTKQWNVASTVTFGNIDNVSLSDDKAGDSTGNQANSIEIKTIAEPVDSSAGRVYAQAKLDLTSDDVKKNIVDGGTLTIGDTTYTFAVGKGSKFKGSENVIDLTDMNAADIAANANGELNKVASRITTAAKDNKNFHVSGNTALGDAGDGAIYLTEKEGGVDTDNYQLEGKANKDADTSVDGNWAGLIKLGKTDTANMGTALTLQIGDTSDDYNQLKVSIGDIHTKALGIDKISIATQAGAAAAVNTIKNAINNVSSIRGTLGATQNRLEHTSNNLSVMKENIQDAESTIRDTDIAEEMMSYTKNNILVQSAQAMLAQANQIPQGVLQLLG